MSKRQKSDKQLFNGLAKDFHELVSNKQTLRNSVENFLHNLIDEIMVGIIFDQHRKYKTDAYDLEMDENKDEVICDGGYDDNLGLTNLKSKRTCICPSCKRKFAAGVKFAGHLRTCMGLGRNGKSRTCNASKRIASISKERESSSSYGRNISDDDGDPDWGSGDPRKKKRDKTKNRNNRGMYLQHCMINVVLSCKNLVFLL